LTQLAEWEFFEFGNQEIAIFWFLAWLAEWDFFGFGNQEIVIFLVKTRDPRRVTF
jgi:hypothetical protein